ncbi:hypothetical protein P3T76_000741 [Phytophthora citrophthora]|uniref:Uncharacterized protein n=1 Tax=Phytophthora citrophthora TaxID=4793 RepID=A0AAD9H186_9STRA|nr:hypothetical protein P3T76_000741 [Phytophthora citrophthora]
MQSNQEKTNTKVTKKYKAWMEIDLMQDVVAVREGQLTKKAARQWSSGADVDTLLGWAYDYRRVSSVSDQEEDGIVEGLLGRARLGFPATRWRLRAMILDVISDGRSAKLDPLIGGLPAFSSGMLREFPFVKGGYSTLPV